jgi:hypothetical protein
MKRLSSSVLSDLPVDSNARPSTPVLPSGEGCASKIAKRPRRGFTAVASAATDARNLEMVRGAARASGEVELLALIASLPFPLNERVELALLELNCLMRLHRDDLPHLTLRASHSWSKAAPTRVVSLVDGAIRSQRVVDIIRHLVEVTFPSAVAAQAAQHVFEAPGWMRSFCQRNHTNPAAVRILEFTLHDAEGRASNALYFPLAD